MKHQKQLSKAELILELEQAGAIIRGNSIKCPFHDDHNPSGGVFQGKDGAWRFKCLSCGVHGDVFDIQAKRTGRPLAEILKNNAQDRPQTKSIPAPIPQAGKMTFDSLEACYDYLRRLGGALECLHEYPDGFYMVRWRVSPERKEMRPLIQQDGGFVMAFPEHRTLYRLPLPEHCLFLRMKISYVWLWRNTTS